MSESKSHDGETLEQAVDRRRDNWEDPFDKHRASRGRYGWYDLLALHALTNIFVTLCREQPRTAGHRWLNQTVATVVVLLVLLPLAGYGLWRLVAG